VQRFRLRGVQMAQALRRADIYEKPAPHPEPVLRMLAPAAGGQDFEQANTEFRAAAGKVQREIGSAARNLASGLSDLYSAARRHTVNFSDRLAKSCQTLASRTAYRLRRTQEEQPLRLLGMIAGVAVAAGIAVRIWRSSHE
jgi:hypothetical protein